VASPPVAHTKEHRGAGAHRADALVAVPPVAVPLVAAAYRSAALIASSMRGNANENPDSISRAGSTR
jgi:hypothetical protein